MRHTPGADPLAATDEWFLRNGLSYFVPEQRAGAKRALRLGRTIPLLVLTGPRRTACQARLPRPPAPVWRW